MALAAASGDPEGHFDFSRGTSSHHDHFLEPIKGSHKKNGLLDDVRDFDTTPVLDTNDQKILHPHLLPIARENSIPKKTMNKILGVDEEEMKRNKALIHLGVSNEDANTAKLLMHQFPEASNRKEEKLTGYTLSQMKRIKAINILGASEEAISDETSKALAALGIGHSMQLLYGNFSSFSPSKRLAPLHARSAAQEERIKAMMDSKPPKVSALEEVNRKRRQDKLRKSAELQNAPEFKNSP